MPLTACPLLLGTLFAARPGETVTAVASAHGYLNLRALAARHHRHYGETPSATLFNRPLPARPLTAAASQPKENRRRFPSVLECNSPHWNAALHAEVW